MKYQLKEESVQLSDRKEISEGCILTNTDREAKTIAEFDSMEDATEELSKYKSSVRCYSPKLYEVTEYYIENSETYEVEDIANLEIKVGVEFTDEEYVYNNFKEAEEKYFSLLDEDKEAYISSNNRLI